MLLMILACGTEVGIIASYDKTQSEDSSSEPTVLEPSQEPAQEDTNVSLNGNVAYLNYYLRQVACPMCVGEPQEITVEFTTKFFENTTASHTEWIPQIGTCTNQLLVTVPTVNYLNLGQSLNIQGQINNFTAYYNGSEYYTNLYESMYDRDYLHTVNLTDGNSFQFLTIRGFDQIEPYQMLYVDPSYAFAAPIYRNGMTFSWAPYGSDSNFMITIAVYTQDGSQLLGYVACTSPDQGFMTVPAQYLQQYPSWSLAAIHLARHRVEYIPYYPLEGYIESHMEWEVVGTGHLE